MKRDDVKKIVDANIEGLKKMLGLSDWDVLVEYGKIPIEDGSTGRGRCIVDPALFDKTAVITLDPKLVEDKEDTLFVLSHELAHIVVSDFDICQTVLSSFLSAEENRAADILFHIAHEKAVSAIQRILATSPQCSGGL